MSTSFKLNIIKMETFEDGLKGGPLWYWKVISEGFSESFVSNPRNFPPISTFLIRKIVTNVLQGA